MQRNLDPISTGFSDAPSPKPNQNKAQAQGLRELVRDRLVLTADKGVAMVIMDRQDYINKSNQLLSQPVYMAMSRDPTNKI